VWRQAHLDSELDGTTVARSFVSASGDVAGSDGGADGSAAAAANDDGARAYGDVDVHANLIRNVVESVASQGGGAGPVTNLLGELQVQVPREWLAQQAGTSDGGAATAAGAAATDADADGAPRPQ
jgi:hypothetical protein